MRELYLATVAMEKNRWVSPASERIPSFAVSPYTARADADGFSGIELWENHYLLADAEEKAKLEQSGAVRIFNTYLSLETAEHPDVVAAVQRLKPQGIKFNFGKAETADLQISHAIALADALPNGVKLLCECHAGTFMEDPQTAGEVFQRLDDRFGAILHLQDTEKIPEVLKYYRHRVEHLHIAYSGKNGFALYAEGAERLIFNWNRIKQAGFDGTATIEFVKDGTTAEETYQTACRELAWVKRNLK